LNNNNLDLKKLSIICGISFLFLFLLIKIYIIYRYGNLVPYWDQWDSEAADLYPKWINGNLKFVDLLAPHNEHRIFTQRVLNLLLFELNARVWNPMLQMYVNAFLHTISLATLLYFFSKSLAPKFKILLFSLSLLLLSIPFGLENTLSGFQSQFYFLLLFTFLFLWGMSNFKVGTLRWWMAFLFGIFCPLSLASGAFSLIVGGLVLLIRKRNEKFVNQIPIWAILLPLIVGIISIYFTPNLPHHAGLKAQSFWQFITSFFSISSWPLRSHSFGGLFLGTIVIQAPLFIFGYLFFSKISFRSPKNLFIFSIALWLVAQILSIAYGRAAAPITSRYLDLFSIGIILNVYIVLNVISNEFKLNTNIFSHSLSFAWLVLIFAGFLPLIKNSISDLEFKSRASAEQEKNVRSYLCNGNSEFLQKGRIPYPDKVRLKTLLDDSSIRSFLPSDLKSEKCS
jgi:hypothetical protein